MRNRTRSRNAGRRLARPGVAPQPPVITAASVGTGDTMDVSFDRPVTTADVSGWFFRINGGGGTGFDSVSGSGTAQLTFFVASTPFAAGQTITVSYSPGSGETVSASGGVELAEVVDRAVQNNLI